MMPLCISAMMAPFSIICGALRGSSAQTFCNTDRVWPVAITMIIPVSAAWRNALYVRGVMCLCGSGVRRVPSRSIASRRYMYYSQAVNIEKNRVFIIIPQDIWYIERFARMEPRLYSYALMLLQPCQNYQAPLY